MNYRAQGLVLRLEPFGEAHSLVTFLTEAHGRLRVLAKGVRRPTSRLARVLLPFSCCSALLWKGRSLDGVSQAAPVRDFPRLRADLSLFTAASYLAEIAAEIVAEGDPSPEGRSVYRLLLQVYAALESGADREILLRYAELQLASLAGWRPRLAECSGCGGELGGGAVFLPGRGLCLCLPCAARPDASEGYRERHGRETAASGRVGPGASRGEEAAENPRGVVLSPDAVALAAFLLGLPASRLGSLRLRAEPAALETLGRALRSHLEVVLERRLKSARLLDIIEVRPSQGGPEEAQSRGG